MAINKEELISENTVLYVDQVRKSYGKKRVLKNMSFSIEKGKIVGFLGPNWCCKVDKWSNASNRWCNPGWGQEDW